MLHLILPLIQIAVLVAACLLTGPCWQRGFYASALLLAGTGFLGAVFLLMGRKPRPPYREPSQVRPVERQTLRNRALLDQAPVPLLFRTLDGTLHVANRAARRLFFTEDRILAPSSSLLSAFEDAHFSGESLIARLCPSPGARPRVYALSISQGDGVGGITHYLALTDVEAGVNAAEAQALRDLLQVLSHEIMNSLTPIVSLAATAQDLAAEPDTPTLHPLLVEALSTIRRRSEGLDRFVRSYRDLARLPPPDLKSMDLCTVLRDVKKLFHAQWGDRVLLDFSVPQFRIMVRLDRDQIEQALLNLLNNGAEATLGKSEPRVSLLLETDGPTVSIIVQDNGPGIPAGQREQIFQPFVSFKTEGNGIGLSLTRQIILGHGWSLVLDEDRISADNVTMHWRTTFRVIL